MEHTYIAKDQLTLATDIVAHARALKPYLREEAPKVEEQRQISKQTIDKFREAGFFKILQPRTWGGYELPLEVLVDVVFEVASACGSSGWVLGILGLHQWDIYSLPEQAQNDIWGKNPEALLSSAYAPTGKVETVDGGFVLSGRWPFSSGCDHADWAILGGLVPQPSGAGMGISGFFVPRTDYEIVDDWYTMGLKGTGSKCIVLKDVFVPDYRQHLTMQFAPPPRADAPPLYRLPFTVVFREPLVATALGVAHGAVERFAERAKVRLGAFDKSKFSENQDYHRSYATADYAVRAARALQHVNLASAGVALAGGLPELGVDELMRARSEAAQSVRTVAEAVMQLYMISGASTLRQGDPLQRSFRDMVATSTHPSFNFNAYGTAYGAMAMQAQG